MKIIICAPIVAANEVDEIKLQLEKMGYEVEVPEGVKNATMRARTEVSNSEKAEDKINNNLIRGYFEKMKNYDVALIVNPEKRGITGYIGGNTFIEMAFAHVLNKKIYCLNPLPDLPYKAEMIAMEPIIINGDLTLIK